MLARPAGTSISAMNLPPADWLIYCRPGFERDCAEETGAEILLATADSGYVLLRGKPRLQFSRLAFARQLIQLAGEVPDLDVRDRMAPILAALPETPRIFDTFFLETPDTDTGKTLSGFTRRFHPILEAGLLKAGRLPSPSAAQSGPPEAHGHTRLHLFFPEAHRALIGVSQVGNSAPEQMGILRIKMRHDAPSRSYLKLAEAIERFLDKEEQSRWLKPGMTAVDLGAAPGGWSWLLAQRGLKVTAVDNGPLKGAAAIHPSIRHVRQDGFRYRPRRPADWLVCDMVEQPQRVARLVAEWMAAGLCTRAIFNLKLPMKKRVPALREAIALIRTTLEAKRLPFRLEARQLYHDREEVTVFLAKSRA